jgi:hypothetical protein
MAGRMVDQPGHRDVVIACQRVVERYRGFRNEVERIRPTNRMVYGDLETRRFTAVSFEPLPSLKVVITREAAGHQRQEFCSDT